MEEADVVQQGYQPAKERESGKLLKIRRAEDELARFSTDAGIFRVRPTAVVYVDDPNELEVVLQAAKKEGAPITPRGSGTSIPSQSVGSGYIVLQTGKKVRVGGRGVNCQPGVVKSELNTILENEGRWLPVDPSSYKACTVGGMVSNNSSGARTFKYGSTIDYLEEVTVFLPEEGIKRITPVRVDEALRGDSTTRRVASVVLDNWKDIVSEAPKTTKNSSGYRLERLIRDGTLDLPKLFAGSEGTLGLIVEVQFRTIAKPRCRRLIALTMASLEELGSVVSRLRSYRPSALELLDKRIFKQSGKESLLGRLRSGIGEYLVYCEVEGDSEEELDAVLERLAVDEKVMQLEPVVLVDPIEIADAWDARSLALNLAGEMREGRRYPVPGVEDVVVPPERLPDIIAFMQDVFEGSGLDYISYGHAGDANLHMRPILDPRDGRDGKLLQEVMDRIFSEVWRIDGSMTGEHGDGRLRAPYVKRQYRRTYEVMREIKTIYDPKWLLNPDVKIQRSG